MRGKHFNKKIAVVAAAAMMGVTSLPLTVMASGLTDVTNDNSDPFKAASTGLVTTTLPTSMDDSVSADGTVVSGSEKLKAFLTAYLCYDSIVESEVRRLDADSDANLVSLRTWVGQSDLCPIYDKGKIIYQYSAWASDHDFDITSPTGNTDATAGYAEVPLTFIYEIGEDGTQVYEQPLTLHVKWGAGVYAASSKFTDVNDYDYFSDSIAWGIDRGIVSGTSATTFSPRANVTRAQFVTFLYRQAGSPDVTINNQFTDISHLSEEFQKAISWAAANGITYGKTDTIFAPNANVKREEAVTFLYRNTKGKEIAYGVTPTTISFKDVKDGAYYNDAIKWGVNNFVVHGLGNDTFGVGENTTRADAITFIERAR